VLTIVIVPVVAPAAVGANFTFSVAVCLGFSVSGKVAPDTVYPLPLIVATVMVNGSTPFEVNVTGSVELDPTPTFPKLRLVGFTPSPAAPVPVPLKLTEAVVELPLIVNAPVAAPADVGANFTVSVNVCLGFSVTGNVAPDTVKPVPLIVAELIVTADVPLEVTVTDFVALELTATFPKLKLVGVTVHCALPAPVPLRLTATVGLVDALLFTVNLPVTAPVAVGANFTLRINVCLGFSVTGNAAPETVKPVPLIVAELIVNADVPVDVTVTGCTDD
jgi:hypothetical protein